MRTTEQQAKSMAYKYFFSRNHIVLQRKPKFDMRYNVSKRAMSIYIDLCNTVNVNEVRLLQIKRAALKKNTSPISIFEQPIVRDYMNNKPVYVYPDRLSFGLRNHWAKNEKDFKILNVLRRCKPTQ